MSVKTRSAEVVKNKLRKFAEINSFSNVIQPQSQHALSRFGYRGGWSDRFFKNNNPLVLEIGCGKGEYTTGLGEAYPGTNFIGIDIKGDRIWKGAKYALDHGLTNVAFLRIQAENIRTFFAKGEVSGIWLTFPDPQSRKSREKKRLTSPAFLERYRNILKEESPVRLKTDNMGLFEYTLETIRAEGHIIDYLSYDLYSAGDIKEPFVREIRTYYERMFLDQGKKIHFVKFFLKSGQAAG